MKIKFTRSQVNRLNFRQRLDAFCIFVNDEMSPFTFKGYGKVWQVNMILNPEDESAKEVVYTASDFLERMMDEYYPWIRKYVIES